MSNYVSVNQTVFEAYEEYVDGEEQSMEEANLYFILFGTLLALSLIGCKLLHDNPKINSFFSEASLVLILGMLTGSIVRIFSSYNSTRQYDNYGKLSQSDDEVLLNPLADSWLSFSPNIFFMALLPPIIFNSGYQLRRELFCRHITPIVSFAAFGTTIAAITTGLMLYGISNSGLLMGKKSSSSFEPTILELLAFGSLIAATDTVCIISVFQSKKVDPHLFYLVFGESALNDAVALVLFSTFSDLLKNQTSASAVEVSDFSFIVKLITEAICSPVLGVVFSFGIAILFKCIDFRNTPMLELPLFLLLMHMPFVVAEWYGLSGVVAIFFSGMSARRYIVPNVSTATATNAEEIFKTVSFLAEISIFLELGLSVFSLPRSSFNWSFIGWSFLASLLGRAAGIYPLAFLYNMSLKERQQTVRLVSDIQKTSNDVPWNATTSANKNQTPSDTGQATIKCDDYVPSHENFVSSPNVINVSTPRLFTRQQLKRKTPRKRKDKVIPLNFVHMIWFAGLRGAVAYACARRFPNVYGHADEVMACTMVIVLVSVIAMGGATEYLLNNLKIQTNVDEDKYMLEWHKEHHLKGAFHDFEKTFLFRVAVREDSIANNDVCGDDDLSFGSLSGDESSFSAYDYRISTEGSNIISKESCS